LSYKNKKGVKLWKSQKNLPKINNRRKLAIENNQILLPKDNFKKLQRLNESRIVVKKTHTPSKTSTVVQMRRDVIKMLCKF
jgi:hypothetical protein